MDKESPTLKVLCHFFMLFFDSLSIPFHACYQLSVFYISPVDGVFCLKVLRKNLNHSQLTSLS